MIAALATPGALFGAQTDAPLVVHDWGTITTRHAPDGTPEGRLNRISPGEVLPAFVHRYEPPATQGKPDRTPTKSPVVPGRPDVRMRLETPVIYFHPPGGPRAVFPFDVSVRFRGGVLNEFYPAATASVSVDVDRIRGKMQARLIRSWDGDVLNNYVVGTHALVPHFSPFASISFLIARSSSSVHGLS